MAPTQAASPKAGARRTPALQSGESETTQTGGRNMRRFVFIAGILLLSLLTLAPKQVVRSISCRSASSLSESRSVTGSYPRCYRFTVPRNKSLLQIKLESSGGAADLYVRQGRVSSLSGGDKVTANATTGQATCVLLNPTATTYTIAVAPSSRGRFHLTATTASSSRGRPSLIEKLFKHRTNRVVAIAIKE
jgi:hypothetical protein